MTCPRCGQTDVPEDEPACRRCGVVFAKLRAPRTRPEVVPPATAEPPPDRGYGSLVGPVLLVVALMGGALWWSKHRAPAGGGPRSPAPAAALPQVVAEAPAPSLVVAPPPSAAPVESSGIPEADLKMANSLATRVNLRARLGATDVQAAEDLYARYPGEKPVRDLLVAVLMSVGATERQQRRFPEAADCLRRAAALDAGTGPRFALLDVLLESGDWPAAEAAAREVLTAEAGNADALEGLGFALFRQDRNRESAEALRAALAIRDSSGARALLARVQKGMADERGMTEQRLSHFTVRYDGEEHEDVGREILRALERHYATLASTLDRQPTATIPVILFSRDAYYDAAGAPAWSGGAYDHLDGRIRIPIGGLTSSLTPDLDGVLIHEVTHGFVADVSRSVCPRDINEGLAQYMEGKRLASLLTPDQMRALADGRARGVGGFYLQALSFVEYLMGVRGQGGMNDLLRAMGETGDVNEAFRRAYGQDYAATQRAWIERVRQQYGS